MQLEKKYNQNSAKRRVHYSVCWSDDIFCRELGYICPLPARWATKKKEFFLVAVKRILNLEVPLSLTAKFYIIINAKTVFNNIIYYIQL